MTEQKIHIMEDFTAQDLSEKDFTGHKFISCTFNYAISNETTKWYGTEFHGCIMTYFNAGGSLFDRCRFMYCEIGFANFKKSIFENCHALFTNFGGSSFKESNLKTFTTENCDFYTTRVQLATVNPYSRDMVSEILRIEAKEDFEKLKLAAFVKVSKLCWGDTMILAKNSKDYESVLKETISVLEKQGMMNNSNLEKYKSHDMEE